MDTKLFIESLKDYLLKEYDTILRPFGLGLHSNGLVQGKFMRSRVAYTLSGDSSQNMLELCTALEMLHTASLVHDDIIDKASLRRGMPTLYKQSGVEQSLLVGNMIVGRAFQMVINHDTALTRQFLDAYMRLNVAQEREIMQRGNFKKTPQDSLDIYEGKTAAMFELPVWIGASVIKNSQDMAGVARALNRIGLAFQIVDDIEDLRTWLNQPTNVKSKRDKVAAYDIELGDYTLPIIYALAELDPTGEESWYNTVSEMVWDTAIAHAFQDATVYLEEAIGIVDNNNEVPMPFRGLIHEYAERLLGEGIGNVK